MIVTHVTLFNTLHNMNFFTVSFICVTLCVCVCVSLLGLGEWFSVYLACCDYCVLCLFECL